MPEKKPFTKALTQERILDPAARLRDLSEAGSSVEVNRSVPIKRYYRSGSEMERQAKVYYSEGQLDKAFILYNKFATLFIEKLPKHPEYSKALPADKMRIKRLLKEAFPRAMELKDKLRKQYEREREELARKIAEEEAKKKAEEERRLTEKRRQEEERRLAEERKREEERKLEEERERQKAEEVAAFLAGQQVGKETAKDGLESGLGQTGTESGQAVVPPASDAIPMTANIASDSIGQQLQAMTIGETRTTVDTVTPTESPVPSTEEPQPPDDDTQLTATDPALAQVLPPVPPAQVAVPYLPATPPAPRPDYGAQLSHPQPVSTLAARSYDSIFQAPAASNQAPLHHQQSHPPFGAPYDAGYYQPPPYGYGGAPPQPQYGGEWGYQGGATEVQYQPEEPYGEDQGPLAPQIDRSTKPADQGPMVPTVDRSTKPSYKAYNALSTSVGNNEGYRQVHIPSDTASRFEEVASTNTRNNTETCGILAGKLSHNVLMVTHIILPKQKGSPDSCETLNEEELFDVQDEYDLITLGWIHTHPSQTAFMSSVDLHTHCSYQIMLDEAIAIVCAPKYGQVGTYMLTEPHGLDYITHCEEPGFHTHPKEPPLYEDCKHVTYDPGSFINIVDLR